ncbi:hypothetical protein [Cellulomonas bogoriensis]|uniref:DUF4232 domain-containing protein n=1 Tax=Cellulomonas bogoriensis 69B4 = DSM 16987 TaxID=1386082 RepID=A0A0A0C086_9CELL|nr:hypothetical protein [Cellulomonas bogoriensis]KGM13600.1 hypothetical protein N869_09990 [Cellulomonas bogoriensis 69B4 = DSM 16987]
MSTVLRPVGPRRPEVYWVRRLVVLGVVAVLVVLLAWAVRAVGSAVAGDPAAPDGAEPLAAGDGGPSPCARDALDVTLEADGRTYDDGTAPLFGVTVRNAGEGACTLDVGSNRVTVTVTSGTDRIWASTDCVRDAPERLLLLSPGSQERVEVPWPRDRSDEGCTAGLPEPRPGTYTAIADVVGVESGRIVLELR